MGVTPKGVCSASSRGSAAYVRLSQLLRATGQPHEAASTGIPQRIPASRSLTCFKPSCWPSRLLSTACTVRGSRAEEYYLIGNLEVVAVNNAQITVEVETKNSEESSNGNSTTGSIVSSTVGRSENQWGGDLKELVRYKFTIADDEEPGKWILFRMLPPVWFDAVTG